MNKQFERLYREGYSKGYEDGKKGKWAPLSCPLGPVPEVAPPPWAPPAIQLDYQMHRRIEQDVANVFQARHDAYMEEYANGFADGKSGTRESS